MVDRPTDRPIYRPAPLAWLKTLFRAISSICFSGEICYGHWSSPCRCMRNWKKLPISVKRQLKHELYLAFAFPRFPKREDTVEEIFCPTEDCGKAPAKSAHSLLKTSSRPQSYNSRRSLLLVSPPSLTCPSKPAARCTRKLEVNPGENPGMVAGLIQEIIPFPSNSVTTSSHKLRLKSLLHASFSPYSIPPSCILSPLSLDAAGSSIQSLRR